jgi:hypothetical protein
VNFVALDDAPLCTAVLSAAMAGRPAPIFPHPLLDALVEAHRAGQAAPAAKRHEKVAGVLVDGVRDGTVLPVFLNVLGLLNLVQQHAGANGASVAVLAEALAPLFLEAGGAHVDRESREWRFQTGRARTVLAFLIENVYVMFPPQVSLSLSLPLPPSLPPSLPPPRLPPTRSVLKCTSPLPPRRGASRLRRRRRRAGLRTTRRRRT